MKTIDAWLDTVPDYARFLTVDELYGRVRAFAERFPEFSRYQEAGRSSAGEPIPMLSVGRGPLHLLLYACPHPNEPVGAMLIQHLLDLLAQTPEWRERYTWHLLPCVDPDGTRLNEGWFAGPFTLTHYAQEFYRPATEEQVEWTFPLQYERYHFDQPMPETRALMTALELAKPDLVYSLHNAGLGGVYYYLSRDLPAVYPEFDRLPAALGLSMAKGEPEVPWGVRFAPGIFKLPGTPSAYDYFEQLAQTDPLKVLEAGGSCHDYLLSLGQDPLVLITELPYFQTPLVSDQTLLEVSRRELLLEGLKLSKQVYLDVQQLYAELGPALTLDTRLSRVSRKFVEYMERSLKSREQAILNDPRTLERATVAQRADALHVHLFYELLMYSTLPRAIQEQRAVADSPQLKRAIERAQALLQPHFSRIEAALNCTPIPIRRTVQMQLGALLAVLPELGVER